MTERLTPKQVQQAINKAKRERLENKVNGFFERCPETCDSYVRQHRFSKSRRWTFDFAFLEEKVAVEIEGGQWVQGQHQRGYGFQRDREKYNAATVAGWHVLAYSTSMIREASIIGDVVELLRQERTDGQEADTGAEGGGTQS